MAQVEEKPVDLRIRRTRKMLQDAFMALMAEKPFAEITVQDITERAMVNRGTFYDHFADNTCCRIFPARDVPHRAGPQIARRFRLHAGQPRPADPRHLRIHVGAVQPLCQPARRISANLQMQITALVQEILTDGFAPRHPANRQDAADLAASVTSWAIFGAALHWSQSDRSEPAAPSSRASCPHPRGSPCIRQCYILFPLSPLRERG